MVPNRGLKTTGGWINHSCTVISHKMIEREMDNRGSKSNKCLFVNEQRVYDSWCIKVINTFKMYSKNFERNWLVKNLSNQLNMPA